MIDASPAGGLPLDSIALAFQMRAIPKSALETRIRELSESELEDLEPIIKSTSRDEWHGRIEYLPIG